MSKKRKVLLIVFTLIFLLFLFLVYRYGFLHLIVIFQRIWHLVFYD